MDNIKEYETEWKMNYLTLCKYLQNKYGLAQRAYFCTPTCKLKAKISRTNEGLACHHKGENEYIKLGESSHAALAPFELQQPQNLVYCNYIEHLMLHIKIVQEYFEQGLKTNQFLGAGGVVLILQNIIDWQKYPPTIPWMKNCNDKIKDDYNFVAFMMDEFEKNKNWKMYKMYKRMLEEING